MGHAMPNSSHHCAAQPTEFANMERVKGIEPSYSAWKAAALPLSYTRVGVLIAYQQAPGKALVH
jgi:hypothetical protein